MDGDEFPVTTATYINTSYHGNHSDDVNILCDTSWSSSPGLTTVEFIAPITVLIVFNLVVVVGNILVIVAVSTHIKLRTATNTFIISLAIADLMLGMTVLPFSSATEVLRYWPFGVMWCNVWLAIDVWLCTASIMSLCAISLDRYLAISRPFKYPRLMSQVRARILATSVWVLSFLICFPPLIGWKEGTQTGALDTGNTTTQAASDIVAIGNNSTGVLQNLGDMQIASDVYVMDDDVNHSLSGHAVSASDVIMSDAAFPGLTSLPCMRASDVVCQLTSEPGYIIYSALGSFWIPVWIMTFFYWKIYRAAARNTSAIRRGVLTTKTSYTHNSPETQVTLRVHRGGGSSTKMTQGAYDDGNSTQHAGRGSTKKNKASDENSFLQKHTPTSSRRYSDTRHNHTHHHDNGCRVSISSKPLMPLRNSSSKNGFFHKNRQPPVRITFSRAEPNGVEPTAGERQPLRQTLAKCRPQRDQELSERSQTDIEETSISMDETTTDGRSTTGFLNKVSRIQLKSYMKRINKEKKAAKTVGIIVGCFIFCWAPFFTVYLLGAFCPGCTPEILFTIFFWLGYCNSAVNPFLYALCSKDFRYAFKKLLRCRVERPHMERTGTRFVNFINSIRIQISTRGSDSNSE